MARKKFATELAPPETQEDFVFHFHGTQEAFYDCTTIYKAYTGGVGSGKTYIGCFDLLMHGIPGSMVAVIAPTYKMLEDSTQRTFIEIAKRMGYWNSSPRAFHKTSNRAILNNGLEVIFRSGDDPEKLPGSTLSYAYLDEAGLMKESVFNVAIARLRHGGKQGHLSATFTPKGKNHWTYRLFADESNPNVSLFNSQTKDNPFISEEYYNNLLLQYSKGEGGILLAEQELGGKFVVVEGAEWGPECFTRWFDDWPSSEDELRVIALDTAKGRGDYSSFCIGKYCKGRLWVEFDIDKKRNTADIASRAIYLHKSFNPHLFGIEAELGGEVFSDDIEVRAASENLMIPILLVPTKGIDKIMRVKRITPYLTRGMVCFKDTPMTHQAVNIMEAWTADPKEVDDPQDSLEMLIRIINESGMVVVDDVA